MAPKFPTRALGSTGEQVSARILRLELAAES
jgi:hypothetical protein